MRHDIHTCESTYWRGPNENTQHLNQKQKIGVHSPITCDAAMWKRIIYKCKCATPEKRKKKALYTTYKKARQFVLFVFIYIHMHNCTTPEQNPKKRRFMLPMIRLGNVCWAMCTCIYIYMFIYIYKYATSEPKKQNNRRVTLPVIRHSNACCSYLYVYVYIEVHNAQTKQNENRRCTLPIIRRGNVCCSNPSILSRCVCMYIICARVWMCVWMNVCNACVCVLCM